jgi:hypothetical protein
MTGPGPDFDELVGRDLEGAERDRLLRVHELLVAAGPPPEFEPERAPEPVAPRVAPLRRRPRVALVALAAAFVVAAFGAGFFVGNRGESAERVVAMAGTGQAAGASASLELFAADQAGNWPMELEIKGLTPAASGRAYELWLTKDGRLAALCGSFRAEPDGTTRVPLNAPYRLADFDSWVVVEEGSKTPLLTTA